MGFFGVMMATICGGIVWRVFCVILDYLWEKAKEIHDERKEEQHRFESEYGGRRKSGGTQMRRIGFGENN